MIGKQHMGITEEVLDSLGNRWEKKQGEVRWYVNDWQEMIGMEVAYYNTGNVCDVVWPAYGASGHPSNCWYKKYVMGTKVWIDADGAVHVDWCKEDSVAKAIVEALDGRIEAVMAPAVVESAELAFAAEGETEEAAEDVEVVYAYFERPDGEVAKVAVPFVEDDLWYSIDKAYPTAWAVLDEGSLIPGYVTVTEWDLSFGPGEDEALARWYAEGVQTVLGALADDRGCQVAVLAKRREGVATVTWTSPDGTARTQVVALNDGDMERLVLGADPVAEGWEDGAGNLVCYDNSEASE